MKAESMIPQQNPIPYGRQCIDDDDIAAVVEALRSDWLTTGPKVGEFEHAFSDLVGASQAVAVSSGTAALHAAMYAIGIGPGDEVLVPAMTFVATANCVVYQGGTPVFVDVDPDTLLIDIDQVELKITPRTRAIIAVDYAGQPCDYDRLRTIADRHGLKLVADACHALGGSYHGRPVGSLADLSAFSLHPVKPITTGEGGMITTDDPMLAQRMRTFRNHGITSDHCQREREGSWFYEMEDLGYNYRLTDFQCALGISQLRKLPSWVARRRELAQRYDEGFMSMAKVRPVVVRPEVVHAFHLYVVRIAGDAFGQARTKAFTALRAEGIGVNVHYIPVHLHPFYRRQYGTAPGLCPNAEAAYEEIVSLPLFTQLTEDDIDRVIQTVYKVVEVRESFQGS